MFVRAAWYLRVCVGVLCVGDVCGACVHLCMYLCMYVYVYMYVRVHIIFYTCAYEHMFMCLCAWVRAAGMHAHSAKLMHGNKQHAHNLIYSELWSAALYSRLPCLRR